MDAPFRSSPIAVRPEWIDYNGHLNMAYYNVLFDTGVDQLWEVLGFGPDYRDTHNHTTFIAEFHVRYLREVHEGDQLTVTYQLLDHDEKRFHFYQEILHPDGWVSASGEGLGLHIDMSGPRVAPMPENILANFRALKKAHEALPIPATVGQPIGIKRK
ncbi:thioesterase family protein [Rhodalgimonas zhirmunskyi]|uniref:Thioesterase family protein n=1 Tax=Rhodalgimonas zhirmunskyi TaxID=2964767 RepID=A0AAJ1UDC4_9RHOB|nr:thioesterase family protein [Rhodoalgimonas zhirmunskyi]MDQ2095433.1 thioesterase family protein [Rhodoalgimonas zhirmunskyi]